MACMDGNEVPATPPATRRAVLQISNHASMNTRQLIIYVSCMFNSFSQNDLVGIRSFQIGTLFLVDRNVRLSTSTGLDGIHRRPHTFRNLLHVDVGRRCRWRMPQQALGRSAFVMSSSSRMRLLRFVDASALLNCAQVK